MIPRILIDLVGICESWGSAFEPLVLENTDAGNGENEACTTLGFGVSYGDHRSAT